MDNKLYSVDKILWTVDKYNGVAIPLCSKDRIELFGVGNDYYGFATDEVIDELECEECRKKFKLNRLLYDEKKYVIEKVLALDRKEYEIIDIDGMQTPVTKKIKINPNAEYFYTTQIRDSKRGPQLVIYAGKKGSNRKSQIFISEEERRLSFDQNDINPADIFAKITAEFHDGTKHTIEKRSNNGLSKQ